MPIWGAQLSLRTGFGNARCHVVFAQTHVRALKSGRLNFSGNARCRSMRIEEISFFTVYSEKCVKMSFHIIHSFTELAFGKPERDLRPALHNDAQMTSYVPGFEYISKNCMGGFRFIFLVCSHDNVNGRQTSAPELTFEHSKRYLPRFTQPYRTPKGTRGRNEI